MKIERVKFKLYFFLNPNGCFSITLKYCELWHNTELKSLIYIARFTRLSNKKGVKICLDNFVDFFHEESSFSLADLQKISAFPGKKEKEEEEIMQMFARLEPSIS